MRQRLPREAQLDHIDHLVTAYATLAGYLNRVEELEIAIGCAYKEAVETEAAFGHLTSILGPAVKGSEIAISKAAWIGQHIFGSRAICVGNRICTQRQAAFGSPLVDQFVEIGMTARNVRYGAALQDADKVGYNKRIDAVFYDATAATIFPLKACWIAPGERPDLRFVPAGPSLFPAAEWLDRADAPTETLASLVLCNMILSTAFPSLNVRPCLMVLDAETWNFQVYETTGTFFRQLSGRCFHLDSLPRLNSSVRWASVGKDLADLERVPDLPAKDSFNRIPVDRAARCYMILNYLWELQSSAEDLVVAGVPAISNAVSRRHLIVYPPDLRRHDIEDCLERGGFIERPRYEQAGYALTPSGVARIIIMRRQLMRGSVDGWDGDTDAHILAPIRNQAHLWAAYKNGTRNGGRWG